MTKHNATQWKINNKRGSYTTNIFFIFCIIINTYISNCVLTRTYNRVENLFMPLLLLYKAICVLSQILYRKLENCIAFIAFSYISSGDISFISRIHWHHHIAYTSYINIIILFKWCSCMCVYVWYLLSSIITISIICYTRVKWHTTMHLYESTFYDVIFHYCNQCHSHRYRQWTRYQHSPAIVLEMQFFFYSSVISLYESNDVV